MKYCHFVTKHFHTLCAHEQGEDTTIILFTNINDTFFYLKMTFFQTKPRNTILHFVKPQKKEIAFTFNLSDFRSHCICYLI